MLGYNIVISRQRANMPDPDSNTPVLASWDGGLSGPDWIERLVKERLATYLGGDGYPASYLVAAGVAIGALQGVKDRRSAPIDITGLLSVDPGEVLLVLAWDQS